MAKNGQNGQIPGVSGISLYVPSLRVQLRDWCDWTGVPWGKVEAVVGRSFRVCAPNESVYTMAASAVLRLILDYDVDPRDVGFLGFGTESSTDNSAGAVIIKGMVDEALEALGKPALSRNCEVPEFKQACLGGVYALKGALRYLATDGRGRRAIVVSADVAEYERGSSGEQTQGAGAVAFLVDERPALFSVDLTRSGSAADYRGLDFRKPFARHFVNGYSQGTERMHDFPVFNGRYSTVCYVDEAVHAVDHMFERLGTTPREYYEDVGAVFFHRPYHRMPIQAMAALYVWGLARDEKDHDKLRELCAQADADFETVLAEIRESPRLFELVCKHGVDAQPHVAVGKVVDTFRRSPEFKEFSRRKMGLGAGLAMDLGNLYTASLPAWLAAAFQDALEQELDIAGQEFVTVGYGSGDAAEAIPIRVVDDWRGAAERIGFRRALDQGRDLTQAQYEAVHDGRAVPELGEAVVAPGFLVDRLGEDDSPAFQDIGIEYYRFVRS